MGVLDYVILAVVAVWFLAAMRSILKKKGGCGCCGTPEGKGRPSGNSCSSAGCGCCSCCKNKE